MTIDEVIERNRERAEKINEKANEQKGLNYGFYLLYKEHAEEYEQIIEWLEDYKKLKSIDEDLRLKYCYEDLSDADNWGYLRGYNEAIDDLTNKLTSDEFQKYNLDFVFETSKSLSYNECISAFCEYIEKISNELKECAE